MFVLAAVDSFPYRVLLLLHILSVIVAFAPGFVNPVLSSRYRRDGEPLPSRVASKVAESTLAIHGPALALAGVFGLGLIGLSSSIYDFSQMWISIAFLLWFIMLGVIFGLLLPAQKKVAAGDAPAEARVAAFNGMLHLLLVLMLIDMIWKPGF